MAAEIGGRFYVAGWGNGVQTQDITPRSRRVTLRSHIWEKIIEVNPIMDCTVAGETKTQFRSQVPCSHALPIGLSGLSPDKSLCQSEAEWTFSRTDRRSRMTSGFRDRVAARPLAILPARAINSSACSLTFSGRLGMLRFRNGVAAAMDGAIGRFAPGTAVLGQPVGAAAGPPPPVGNADEATLDYQPFSIRWIIIPTPIRGFVVQYRLKH